MVDLLTGEESFSNHIVQPVTGNIVDNGSDFLDFLDQAVVEYHGGAETDNKFSSSQDGRNPISSSQQYISCLKSLVGPHLVRHYLIHHSYSY